MQENNKLGKKLFTFAVVADTHLNQDEIECNSPFPVNKLANYRMRHVVRSLNESEIDFVVHLGDIIHPVPAVKELYMGAAKRFQDQVKDLKHPLYLTPGNHDIGDKPMPWAPAGCITDDYIALWREVFGQDYYSFDHKDIHFVVINSQLCNSGLAAEVEQEEWIKNDLCMHSSKRIFICTHYPPFMLTSKECEHYDNIAEPARGRLLSLLTDVKTEALFAGHVHNFWYLQEEEISHYLLPSTAFVRQDYSEMFKAPPDLESTEAGRDDAAKLGYFLVTIYEHGHVCRMVRTYGKCVEPNAPFDAKKQYVRTLSPIENTFATLGFDLRQSWADSVGIPPSGALDEFDRKEVRNDYPLLALWEMGVRRLRVPFKDLRTESVRTRMKELISLGHEFTLFSFGIPVMSDMEILEKYQHLFTGWEISLHWQNLESFTKELKVVRQKILLPIFLSRMWEHEDNKSPDGRYFHVMNHGFTKKDVLNEEKFLQMEKYEELNGVGIVFRIMQHENINEVLNVAYSIQAKYKRPISAHLRMADFNPAQTNFNNIKNAQNLAEALFCSAGKEISVFADTLTDIDRGYFVRNGVLDQTCNPRQAARVIANLYGCISCGVGALEGVKEVFDINNNRYLWTTQGNEIIALIFVQEGQEMLPPQEIQSSKVEIVDLDTGVYIDKEKIRNNLALYLWRASF